MAKYIDENAQAQRIERHESLVGKGLLLWDVERIVSRVGLGDAVVSTVVLHAARVGDCMCRGDHMAKVGGPLSLDLGRGDGVAGWVATRAALGAAMRLPRGSVRAGRRGILGAGVNQRESDPALLLGHLLVSGERVPAQWGLFPMAAGRWAVVLASVAVVHSPLQECRSVLQGRPDVAYGVPGTRAALRVHERAAGCRCASVRGRTLLEED